TLALNHLSAHSLRAHRNGPSHLLNVAPKLGELVAALGEPNDPRRVEGRRIWVAEYVGPRAVDHADHAVDQRDALGIDDEALHEAALLTREPVAAPAFAHWRQRRQGSARLAVDRLHFVIGFSSGHEMEMLCPVPAGSPAPLKFK